VQPLKEWLKTPANARNAGFLKEAIGDYEKGGKVSINDLEEIRKEAVAKTDSADGTTRHYAGDAVGVIDGILDNAGSSAYRVARQKFRAADAEFAKQSRVAGLVENKGYTSDRAVALEDTFDNVVLKGSDEQLRTVKSTLQSDPAGAKGIQAWKDLQGATIDYLRDKAAGRRAIPGESGQLQFNSTFLDALHDLDADGKIDTLFGPEAATKIREIAQATRDVRTKPTGRIAGSDTASRIFATLEKAAPYAGHFAGVARVVGKVRALGEESRAARRATTTPLDEAIEGVERQRQHQNTLKSLRRAAPAVVPTLAQQENSTSP
jgi:hypothetical protein